ncbi:HK97 gp10 family phage protein [Methanospirillum sp. J.3.6.1-F.2.7.3]|uniref:HK97 gp10 family phage protein n=1 Tax=Methanospirillum purgamenti TaxID=2834276 RepID=A0A8E7B0V2_9EURY|nr:MULTISPECIES: HK97 gp10 family phage protein [Methanospirillum]MDX8549651.1 HK97 gp10 family phage protein [Methanospirillum hungatei]QVV89033.1 HK97 gp10 family phage protein [Methanospirillum sp. J.3.6.1-F.2.7.3]
MENIKRSFVLPYFAISGRLEGVKMAKRCTPEEMLQRLAGLKKGCEEGIRQGLIKSAAVAETQVKKNLSPGSTPYKFAPFDTGLLRGHIGYNVDVQGDEWTAMVGVEKSGNQDTYAKYVHDGTRPHNAPFEAIQRWAERKSRGGKDFQWFPIWLKIAREGTEPKPFVTDAIAETQDQYPGLIDAEYKKALIAYCARYG